MGSYSSKAFVFESIGSTTYNHWFAGKAEDGNGILVVDSKAPTGSLLASDNNTYYNNGAIIVAGTDLDSTNREVIFCVKQNGYVGIGTASPNVPLYVSGSASTSHPNGTSFIFFATGGGYGTRTNRGAGGPVDNSIIATNRVAATEFNAYSDRRIKDNIVDVPDNISLQTLRDISCCYYGYRDKLTNGTSKTIGFIAQQVRQVMPMAVSFIKNFIPNEMRIIENPMWTTITDNSGNNKYKLTIPDLEDVSGNTKYKFYVSNEDSGKDEREKDYFSLENEPKSFIFDEKYNNIFLYGKEVNDFHSLCKNKLFTINFSATQEIDRIQQQEKEKVETLFEKNIEINEEITKLKQENYQQKNKIATLENKLLLLMQRIESLETINNQ